MGGIWPSRLDSGLPSWNLAFGGLLRLNLNSCGFLGLFVFCCTVAAYLPTNVLTLPARRLINTVSYHARRSISHKGTPQERSKQSNKQTNEQTNERTSGRTNEGTHGQKNKQAHKQAINERTNERTGKQTKKGTNRHRNKQTHK